VIRPMFKEANGKKRGGESTKRHQGVGKWRFCTVRKKKQKGNRGTPGVFERRRGGRQMSLLRQKGCFMGGVRRRTPYSPRTD